MRALASFNCNLRGIAAIQSIDRFVLCEKVERFIPNNYSCFFFALLDLLEMKC